MIVTTMTMTASPLQRCLKCGVLERIDRHRCDPVVQAQYEQERRGGKLLTLENAHV